MKKISILLMMVFLAAFLTAGAASAEEEAFGESLQTPHALVMEVSTGKVLFGLAESAGTNTNREGAV